MFLFTIWNSLHNQSASPSSMHLTWNDMHLLMYEGLFCDLIGRCVNLLFCSKVKSDRDATRSVKPFLAKCALRFPGSEGGGVRSRRILRELNIQIERGSLVQTIVCNLNIPILTAGLTCSLR